MGDDDVPLDRDGAAGRQLLPPFGLSSATWAKAIPPLNTNVTNNAVAVLFKFSIISGRMFRLPCLLYATKRYLVSFAKRTGIRRFSSRKSYEEVVDHPEQWPDSKPLEKIWPPKSKQLTLRCPILEERCRGTVDEPRMKILIALMVLTALALIGSRRLKASGKGPPAARMLFGGSEFIVIGLLIGGDFFGLVDEATLQALRPFVYVALGWLAFLFGLQLDRRTVARLPTGFVTISAAIAAVTMMIVFPLSWLLLSQVTDAEFGAVTLAAATLAGSAACTGQTAITLVGRRRGSSGTPVMTLLRYISSLDPVVGVTVFGVALAVLAARPTWAAGFPWTLQWVVFAVCLGFLTAWFLVSLTLTRTSQAELALYLLGVIALSSGVALGFDLSVLLINFVCGVAVANLTHVRSIRGRLMVLLVRGERFLYLLLLVVAGATWRLPTCAVVVGAAVYIGVRLLGKTGGAFLATRAMARRGSIPPLVGLGLASQGGMALAIIIEYRLAVDDALASFVVGVAMTSILANELMAPWLINKVAVWAEGDAT